MIAFLGVKLIVLHLLGVNGLSPIQAMDVATDAVKHINTESKYANVRIVDYDQIENGELVATLDNQSSLLTKIRRHIADNNLQQKRTIFAVIVPPAVYKEKFYTGGAAYVCPFSEDPSYAVLYIAAAAKNSLGEDRILHAKTAFAHELGHILCAQHDNILPPTLMNSNALFWVDRKILPLSSRSKRAIKRGWLHSLIRRRR